MGTSTSFRQLASKLDQVAENIEQARLASFRQAERDMMPIFNREARNAAGGDRRLSNAGKGVLTANFQVSNGSSISSLEIRPKGPWGIRDNTDTSGGTTPHTISAKRASRLQFVSRRTGKLVYARAVSHPGSWRAAYWGAARRDAFDKVRQRLPEDVRDAIVAALNGSGFKSRR